MHTHVYNMLRNTSSTWCLLTRPMDHILRMGPMPSPTYIVSVRNQFTQRNRMVTIILLLIFPRAYISEWIAGSVGIATIYKLVSLLSPPFTKFADDPQISNVHTDFRASAFSKAKKIAFKFLSLDASAPRNPAKWAACREDCEALLEDFFFSHARDEVLFWNSVKHKI